MSKKTASRSRLDLVVAAVCVVLYLVCFIKFVEHAGDGFDITDEGMYLNSVTDLRTQDSTSSGWAYYARLLWLVSGQSLAAYRVVGFVVLTAWAAFFAAGMRQAVRLELSRPQWVAVLTATILGAASYYAFLPRTVSYNYLNAGFTLLAGGALGYGLGKKHAGWFAAAGVFCALVALVKWPTGVVLTAGMIGLAVVWPDLTVRQRAMLAAAGLAGVVLGLFAHFSILEDFSHYRSRSANARYVQGILGAGHGEPTKLLMGYVNQTAATLGRAGKHAGLIVIGAVALSFVSPARRWVLPVAFGAVLLVSVFRGTHSGGINKAPNLALPVLGYAMVLVAVSLTETIRRRSAQRRSVLIFVTLAVLPLAYAVGTGTPLPVAVVGAFGAPYLALALGVIVVQRQLDPAGKLTGPVSIGLLCATASIQIVTAEDDSYRLSAPMDAQTVALSLPHAADHELDSPTHTFFVSMNRAAKSCGFEKGTDIIDFSGASPGAVFALEGRSPFVAWWIGGYPGSKRYAKWALGQVSKDRLSKAWLLVAPSGRRSLGAKVALQSAGLALSDFQKCGEGFWPERKERIELWRPKSPGAM